MLGRPDCALPTAERAAHAPRPTRTTESGCPVCAPGPSTTADRRRPRMIRIAFRSALVALVSLAVAGTGRAETKPHKESTDGTINVSELVSATVALQEWTAEGRATQFGRYTEAGSHKADLATGAIYDGV